MSNEKPKRRLRVLQPSMSNASLLLACQWWVGKAASSQPLDNVIEMHEDGTLVKPPKYSPPAPSVDISTLAVWQPPREVSESGNALSDTEGANYGSGIHEVLAARIVSPPKKLKIVDVAAKWGITESDDVKAFRAHAEEAVESFIGWMTKKNPWGVDLTRHAKIRTEMAVAYNVEKNTTRLIPTPTADTHEYRGLEIGELPGTADVVFDEVDKKAKAAGAPDLILIDHKSGDGWNMPVENDQLWSLTNANAVRIGAKNAAMGIFHTPVENVSTMFIDEIDREQMRDFRAQLKAAWRRIGDGSMRPGPHCAFCQAATVCPTQQSAIVQVETSMAMTPERVGEMAQKLAIFKKSAEKIDDEIKAWIKQFGLPGSDKSRAVPLPSGKWLRTKPTKQAAWQITTKQVIEVLGAEAAEKLFEALRKAGYLKGREYDDWKTVNDT